MTRGIVLFVWIVFMLLVLLSPKAWWAVVPGPYEWEYFDKVAHFGLFAVTQVITLYWLAFLGRFSSRILFAVLLGLLLAFGTEIGQSFVSGRDLSLFDLAANLGGLWPAWLSTPISTIVINVTPRPDCSIDIPHPEPPLFGPTVPIPLL